MGDDLPYVYYIACPYSHKDPGVMKDRVEISNIISAQYASEGKVVFNPIGHSAGIQPFMPGGQAECDFDFWVKKFDRAFMQMCSELVVVMIDGWAQSRGVLYEIAYFKERKKKITYEEA